jgi:uncharacterized protein (TIGR03083 family)
MTPEQYLEHMRADTERMLEVAAKGLEPDVPACPGWTVGEALVHTGEVYSHKVACMRLGKSPQEWDHGPAEGRDPLEWFRERFDELERELTSHRPDEPTYTWHDGQRNVGFWCRRMAQETAVHRVDVESGHDAVTPVPDDLAIDGIDEVLDWFLVYWHEEEVGSDAPGRGTVAVRTGDHIWRATLTADAATLDREPGHADAVVSGEPSELLLWLWGRRPDSAVIREGDDDLLRGFRERLRLVTQ